MSACASHGFEAGRDLLWWPPDPDAATGQRPPWPTIVFLHGKGERGGPAELAAVARWGLPRLRLAGRSPIAGPFPFLVAAPQCGAEHTWCDGAIAGRLAGLVDDLVATGRADPRRLFIAGFSLGGIGAFALALGHPQRFAALVSVCGRCPEEDRLAELCELPAWIAYAEDDEIEELADGSRVAIAALAPYGRIESRPYRLGAADGLGAHVRTCEAAFTDPALYAWLEAQCRR